GSETRRKFIDGVISQSDNKYLNNLINYGKILAQRNSLLKYFAANNSFDRDTLSIYDMQLEELGNGLYLKRKEFMKTFIPIFQKRYETISNGREDVSIVY
ncbi:DNA replication and repair protein RecF, partial [Salinimicrobium sp. CDJ15-91]|nr:DNA replication and repair protein RecF [Salinimicrobium oceani]